MSEFAQQICRAGRDGLQAVCVCFFNPRDSGGVRLVINENKPPESESSTRFNKIIQHTAATGKTPFMHVADFRAARVGPKQESRVLACLQRLGATRAGLTVPRRIAVRPDENLMARFADLSDDAQALWTKHVMPQQRRRGPSRPQNARFDVRAVFRESPFLDNGWAGSAAVHGAFNEMRHESVSVVDTSEGYSAVVPLEVLANIEQAGWRRRLVDILPEDIAADFEVVKDVPSFMQWRGCITRQLLSRFGAESEVGLRVPICLCRVKCTFAVPQRQLALEYVVSLCICLVTLHVLICISFSGEPIRG